MAGVHDLPEAFGNIDIYLLDQLLRGHVAPDAKVLDAGCGRGRNLYWFARNGHEVFGVDADPEAVATCAQLAEGFGGSEPSGAGDREHFRVEPIEALSFDDAQFDVVICNAVLHFARDVDHFVAMASALRRVTRPGGLVFTRLASSTGIERFLDPNAPVPGWHRLPDGSDRFLVSLEYLAEVTAQLGVDLVDPIKTVNVQNLRCMTNWVWRPRA